jgi:hypothetical protein
MYGPDELAEMDERLARRDSRHRAKRLEDQFNSAMRAVWFRIVRWAKKQDRKTSEWERRLRKVWLR